MKTYSNLLTAFLIVCLACTENENQNDVKSKAGESLNAGKIVYSQSTGFIPVAKINPETGKLNILVDKLVRTFEDGGPIKYFGVRKSGAEYGFVRMGYDSHGNYRSETFKTQSEGTSIGLSVQFEAVWYILCSGSCFGCMSSANGSKCECDTHLELEDGKLIIVDATGAEQDPSHEGNAGGNCAAGAGGSSLYTNVVFH